MTTTNDLTAIEGIDINCSYEMICIDRLNTKVNTIPGADPTIRSDLNANIANTNTNTANITTLTTISNNNRRIYNVKDYGAIGNDIADDTSAINSAISAIISDTNFSSVLYFPRGTYRTSGQMKILNKYNILILSDGATIRHTTGVDCLFFDGCNNLKMSGNLYIFTQTTGLTCQGLTIRNCEYCQFSGLHIGGDFIYGIYIFEDNGFRANTLSATIFGARAGIFIPVGSEYFNIHNCCISQCGIGISCGGANILINNCEINENRIGIYILGTGIGGSGNSDHCGINNCSLNHNRACGIFLKNLRFSMSISGCQIWANNGPDNLVEAENVIAKNNRYGIYLEKAYNVSITGNVIAHNDKIEIGYDGLTNSIISNNVFRSVDTCLFPIYEFYTAGNSYNNNQFCNNIFSGNSSNHGGAIPSSLLRFYLGNMVNDGASGYIIKDNIGENKNNNLLMAVNSGDYFIGCANNYVIDGLTITTSNSSDPSAQTANIYILPHATGTHFKLFFRRNNITGYTWLRYKSNNTSLAPYIIGNNVIYSVAIRCFRIGPLNSVEFSPMSNTGLGEWCIVGA